MGPDEKRKFGDQYCGLISRDEQVQVLKIHSRQEGSCEIAEK